MDGVVGLSGGVQCGELQVDIEDSSGQHVRTEVSGSTSSGLWAELCHGAVGELRSTKVNEGTL